MGTAERSLELRTHKLLLGVLKVIPMLLALHTIINMMFDFFGIETSAFSIIGGVSILPLAFLYLASYVFKFCIYHRMFLHYVLVNNIITYIDFYVGIPVATLTLFVIHLVVIGLFLFLILYFYRRERCCR
jgi:hypothetical protein